MPPTDAQPMMLYVESTQREVLDELAATLSGLDLRASNVRQKQEIGAAPLDLTAMATFAYEIAVHVATVAPAIQLLYWAYEKARSFKSPQDSISIRIGDKTVTITGTSDLGELKRLLGFPESASPSTK